MPSTYANNLRLESIANGEQSGSWGDTTNKNICSLLVDSITAVTSISITGAGNYVLSANAGTTDEARTAVLRFTGLRSADCYVTAPAVAKTYIIDNYTDQPLGNKNILMRTAAGAVATVPFGRYMVYCDGLDFFVLTGFASGGTVTGTLAVTGATTLATSLTGALVGTAGVVSAVAPGTAGNLLTSNGTAWTSASSGVTVSSFSAGTTGLTPSIATTGAVVLAGTLAVANGGTGVTSSTGSGANVLGTSPVLTTPNIGTPSDGVLTNCTGTAASLNAGIGVGQTWKDVISSPGRAAGSTYTNTTGKPIFVLITCISGGSTITGTVDGLTFTTGVGAGSYYNASTIFLVVPHLSTYSTNSFGAGSQSWYELS